MSGDLFGDGPPTCPKHKGPLPCMHCRKESAPRDLVVNGDRDGVTYCPNRDRARLGVQAGEVFDLMRDGSWRSLHAISVGTGHPEASISARLRDLRKERFGAYDVERRNKGGGMWEYRLTDAD